MKLTKKDIMLLILYTITILFCFIYIKEIFIFIKYIFTIFKPIIIGLMIAYVLNVLVNVIENKWLKSMKESKESIRGISLTIAVLIVIFIFILLLLIIIPNLEETIRVFISNMPNYIDNLHDSLIKLNLNDFTINNVLESINALSDTANAYILDNTDKIVKTTFGIASSVLNGFINLFIGLVFAIYYLASKERLHKEFVKIAKAYLPKKSINKLKKIITLSNNVFTNFIGGQCLEAIIIGVLCFIGMVLLRLPFALAISILVGFTALIPVFGAFIGTILGAFLIFMINPLEAIIFIIYIIVLQQLEGNLIYPYVVGKSIGLPGIWVLVSVTVGANIGGILGMFLSVPLASILYSLLKESVNSKLKNENATQ